MKRSILPTIAIIVFAMALTAADNPGVEQVKSSAALATSAGTWVGVGPGGVVLPAGVYRFAFFPTDTAKEVEVTTINTAGGTGGGGGGGGGGVPDNAKAFADALAAVTEPAKIKTASDVKLLIDPVAASAEKGELTDLDNAKSQLPFFVGLITADKTGWDGFVSVLKSRLATATTVSQVAAVLGAASDELGKVK